MDGCLSLGRCQQSVGITSNGAYGKSTAMSINDVSELVGFEDQQISVSCTRGMSLCS